MDCLEYRRTCLADPANRSPVLLQHRRDCARCGAFHRRVLRAEQGIRAAMQVPVSENLASRVLLGQQLQQRTGGRRRQVWVAAALLLLAIGFGFMATRPPDLTAEFARHMAADPLHIASAQRDADYRTDRVLQHLGGELDGSTAPTVTHASLCLVDGIPMAHLVLAGRHGPVTVFVAPGQRLRATQQMRNGVQVGLVSRLEFGSIALFGQPGEALEAVRDQLVAGLRFSGEGSPREVLAAMVRAMESGHDHRG